MHSRHTLVYSVCLCLWTVYAICVVGLNTFYYFYRFNLLKFWIGEWQKQRQSSINSTTTYTLRSVACIYDQNSLKVVDPKYIYILIEECLISVKIFPLDNVHTFTYISTYLANQVSASFFIKRLRQFRIGSK